MVKQRKKKIDKLKSDEIIEEKDYYKKNLSSVAKELEILFLFSSVIICLVISLISFVTQGKNQIRINCKNPDHIIIMTHGWAGTPANMDVFGERLIQKNKSRDEYQGNFEYYKEQNGPEPPYGGSCLLIYKVHSNWGYFRSIFITSDGIEKGAKRMSSEIKEIIKKNPTLRKISFIGHSLGGLYNRAVLPLLANTNTLEDGNIDFKGENIRLISGLVPMNFISIGTPHKGVLRDKCTLFGLEILRFIFPLKFISILPTISQLLLMDKSAFLVDKMMNSMEMIHPLSWFRHRHAIGSIKGDMLVPPTSASLLQYCIKNDIPKKHTNKEHNGKKKCDITNQFKNLHSYLNSHYYKSNNRNTGVVINDKSKMSSISGDLINWITVIDSGKTDKNTDYMDEDEYMCQNIGMGVEKPPKNKRAMGINEFSENKLKCSDSKMYKHIHGNIDKLSWMKTSVLFKNRIHRMFSHQLMMYCFENWGYFLLGNNFQLLDHIIENMYL
ncbi:hypothetical protein FG386_000723 [Cryptosporidium ryanae]|uniref:uncharacterized protein n=1 Tax=Cryptosporidium ryanae TaxID=515981 RepID=UPI00351A9AE5|nr:hypothetical protein FG386_000723 [Cryptosporidium ryanae]